MMNDLRIHEHPASQRIGDPLARRGMGNRLGHRIYHLLVGFMRPIGPIVTIPIRPVVMVDDRFSCDIDLRGSVRSDQIRFVDIQHRLNSELREVLPLCLGDAPNAAIGLVLFRPGGIDEDFQIKFSEGAWQHVESPHL